MQEFFYDIAKGINSLLQGQEAFRAWFSGEVSNFSRFNHAKIRQAGAVSQSYVTVELINGQRHAQAKMSLVGHYSDDKNAIKKLVTQLRNTVEMVPEDPYLPSDGPLQNTHHTRPCAMPSAHEICEQIAQTAQGLDLVGILAQGQLFRGFANGAGQRNWFESSSFNFDFSVYHERDLAIKSRYAGVNFISDELDQKITEAASQLEFMKLPPCSIKPGKYPVYLSPAALGEIISLLQWGGLSIKAHRNKNAPLLLMSDEAKTLSPLINLDEDCAHGIGPSFQTEGYIMPDRLPLIEAGALKNLLISPRSAKEFGLLTNAAGAGEQVGSVAMKPGHLNESRCLQELSSGIYVGNLWYLNYSDRVKGRMTGMTRFGTFLVEKGEIVGPLAVMRFDDSIFSMLGDNLLALSTQREFMIDSETYGERSTQSYYLPGALIKDFNFTL